MPNERLVPTPAAPSVNTFTVTSDGVPVPAEVQVLSIVVHKELNRIPTATLIVRDGSAASQTFGISDSEHFIPGKTLQITSGYQAVEDKIFKGVVVSQSLKMREQASVLTVICKDASFKMTVKRNSRYFTDQKDSDVFEDIINQYGLTPDVEATTEEHRSLVQFHSTDWDFVLSRADMLGKVVLAEDGKLKIAAPDFNQPEGLSLQFGATMLEFDADMDARSQFSSVKTLSWGSPDQEIRESEETTDPFMEAGNLSGSTLADVHGAKELTDMHSGNLSEAELQNWAKARLLRSRLAKLRGRVKCQGIASLQPGQIIKLEGVGARFEGKVYVSAVRHEIGDGNWTTDVQFGLSPEHFAETFAMQAPAAGGLLPPVSGLQTGVVTQLEEDPDGEHRIKVRLPMVHASDEGNWARVSTLDAGNNRGSFFRPEIGDEVVVGFFQNDPRHPVVLGALNSSAKPAPLEAKDDNHEKGFVTRSGMKLLFDDDKKNVLLETPDGNKVAISGEDQSITIEDQHGNKLVFDSNGITMESSKNMVLKAQLDLTAEASKNLTCKASAMGEFSASGSTTIKGGLVQIN